MEHVLDQRRVSLGRGPGVDLALDDESLVCEHAELEVRSLALSAPHHALRRDGWL